MIRLFIVHENEFLRLGLRTAIEKEEGIEVVEDSSPTDRTVALVANLKPDVVLMGINPSSLNTVTACREIRVETPSTRVVMLSSLEMEEELLISILAGASGYVTTNTRVSELVQSIRIAVHGGSYFDWGAAERIVRSVKDRLSAGEYMSGDGTLSERESIILSMVGEGCSNEEIGQRLKIATTTARNQITRIRSKLGLDSRVKLAAYAVRRGIHTHVDGSIGILEDTT